MNDIFIKLIQKKLDNILVVAYDESNKAEYELIQSSGGNGPMKLRQPLTCVKTVPIPLGFAYKMRVGK